MEGTQKHELVKLSTNLPSLCAVTLKFFQFMYLANVNVKKKKIIIHTLKDDRYACMSETEV